nr:MAG TPA: hypothetical protein [Caudoviricetes sp.]
MGGYLTFLASRRFCDKCLVHSSTPLVFSFQP